MGSFLRSEEMGLRQLILQPETAYACLAELGELGIVQFRDLNPNVNAFQRKFVNEVRRCDNMEHKLTFLTNAITKAGIPILDTSENPDAPQPSEIASHEIVLEKLETDLKAIMSNQKTLKENFQELSHMKHLLRKTNAFFQTVPSIAETLGGDEISDSLLPDARHNVDLQLNFVAGVIGREKLASFERLLWRACGANVYLKYAEIEAAEEDPTNGDRVYNAVFVIFFQGEKLNSRVRKICQGYHATLYPCPDSAQERREMAISIMTRIEDLRLVLSQTEEYEHKLLVAAAKNLRVWSIKVRKIKAIYHTLNMFNLDVTRKCLIGECWCPVRDMDLIHMALLRGKAKSGGSLLPILNPVTTRKSPPTYFRTNKFTKVFQTIVDSYGVPSYTEVNPALFTIISFPFLFSVMFGDAGHGVLVAAFAFYLIWNEKKYMGEKTDNEIWKIFFGGRYIIFLMGLFSVYSGLMYNDCFAKSFNIFGSAWYPADDKFQGPNALSSRPSFALDPNTDYSGAPYPFGIDPVWSLSTNKITFLNSYKMKISVTFGIAQMLFGVILSFVNHRYFKRPINIFCEFIPEVIFMVSIFVYLIVLIFYKWFAYSAANSSCAPSLLIHFINMFLVTYPPAPCSATTFYPGQQTLQMALLILAVICIPWLLFIKPFILWRQNKTKQRTALTVAPIERADWSLNRDLSFSSVQHRTVSEELDVMRQKRPATATRASSEPEEVEFSLGDVMIHQTIHTIEYCLGCVSHTASYLRLWALSLAHAQLSEVLWNMVLRLALTMGGYTGVVAVFIIFIPWACLTVGILLLMEGLSAFLHTLRLHWVEFQSKFYEGDGIKFTPFSFEDLQESTSND